MFSSLVWCLPVLSQSDVLIQLAYLSCPPVLALGCTKSQHNLGWKGPGGQLFQTPMQSEASLEVRSALEYSPVHTDCMKRLKARPVIKQYIRD